MTEKWFGEGYMVDSLHDDQQVDKDGMATLGYPGARNGRLRMGYSTPTRRRARRMEGRAKAVRRRRQEQRDYHQAKYLLRRINREIQLREVEEALEQAAAEGLIIKNPDGTFSPKPPTLADRMHDRRGRMR